MFQGRYVTHVELEKPESGGLGFSVVGLKSENHGELGIFIQEIQPGSVAHWYVGVVRRQAALSQTLSNFLRPSAATGSSERPTRSWPSTASLWTRR